jgi:hypothetical protein
MEVGDVRKPIRTPQSRLRRQPKRFGRRPRLGKVVVEAVPDAPGMGHLNRVLVAIKGGVLILPWESRDAVLDKLRGRNDARHVISAFEAAGAGPVELDVLDQVVVADTIRDMERKGRLPDGLDDLLAALVDELHGHE